MVDKDELKDLKEPKVVLNGPEVEAKAAADQAKADKAEAADVKKQEKAGKEPIATEQANPARIVPADGKRYVQAQKEFVKDEAAGRFVFDGKYWHGRDDGDQIVFDYLGDVPPEGAVVPGASA